MYLTEAETKAQSGYGGDITVTFQDNVAIIQMSRGENRFNYDFVARFNKALDMAEQNPHCIGIVTTGTGKFYSNGLDLEWFKILGQRDPKLVEEFNRDHADKLICRLIAFPLPLIAAINGHAYAMGALMAITHDHRIMREDRGWFCLNEVYIGMVIKSTAPTGMLLRLRLSQPMFHDAVILGKRYTGPEAEHASLVHSTSPPDRVLPQALSVAKGFKGLPRETLRGMKESFYAGILQAQRGPPKSNL